MIWIGATLNMAMKHVEVLGMICVGGLVFIIIIITVQVVNFGAL